LPFASVTPFEILCHRIGVEGLAGPRAVPALCADRQWHEESSAMSEAEHSLVDKLRARSMSL